MDTAIMLITAVLGSNALTACLQHWFTKKTRDHEGETLLRKTLAAVTYGTLSNEIERLLTKDFATPDERKTLTVLYEAYKENGWNGDMNARMDKVYHLRTDSPRKGE